ncbi:Toprim domain-containing protein [Nocardia tenerifensis]|uniref:Toprim domain-containing protein n=1 Tax=Nocardia tenerifensis TaxID=228006 RepID=A0A318KIE1_9NOCA|nr:toprim domain-containing protein [Nocardia tenerifensis]PXX66923.1 Toprim domain-containing protein [Nocardia tenerifensis]
MTQHQPVGPSYHLITTALKRTMGPGHGTSDPTRWTNYLCPVHEGDGRPHTPSLGVRYDPEQARTIVRCWATCDDEKVLERLPHPTENRQLGVRDMFDRLPERRHDATTHRGGRREGTAEVVSPVEKAILAARLPILSKPDLGVQTGVPEKVDAYLYRWPDGHVEGAVIRVHTPHEHGVRKSFYQRHLTGTGWEDAGFAPIPFQLPDIREALDTGREIYVCEGEKDVLRANQAGQIATCNVGGAGSWTPEHARWLAGAGRVIVVADRDRPGYRHAAKVADTLTGRVGEVRVMQARGGKDLSDHLDAGYELSELEPVRYLDRPQQPPPFRDPTVNRARTRSR